MMYNAPPAGPGGMRQRMMAQMQAQGGGPGAAPAPQAPPMAPPPMAPQGGGGWNGQMPGRMQMPPSRMPWGGQQPPQAPPQVQRRPMMNRMQPPMGGGGYPPGVDPRAAMADPQGYAQWQQDAAAHGWANGRPATPQAQALAGVGSMQAHTQMGPQAEAQNARAMYGGHGQDDDRQPPMGGQGGGYGGGYGGMSQQAMGGQPGMSNGPRYAPGPMGGAQGQMSQVMRGPQGGAQGNPYMDMMRRRMMQPQQQGQQQAMNQLGQALL